MLRPLRIGQAFGIPIFLHWTFFLLPLLVIYLNQDEPLDTMAMHMALLAGGFFCVVLHEFGHALTARRFGVNTRDVTLYPIGGIASLERMPEKPWEEFWIAVAGPAVNVVIAAVLFAGLLAVGLFNSVLVTDNAVSQYFWMLLATNVFLVVFNMIPAFPMDGGRVLRSLLAAHMGQLRATRIAVTVGTVMAVLMGAAGLFLTYIGSSPMLMVIAFFILMIGPRELQILEARERARQEEEPLTVIPVRRVNPMPLPTVPGYVVQPSIRVYTWDEREGIWVPDSGSRPSPAADH